VGSDGGVFSFGDAQYYGSTAGKGFGQDRRNGRHPRRGRLLARGKRWRRLRLRERTFHGSIAGQALNGPIVAITADGGGYRLVGSAGAVFAFGGASFYGAAGSPDAQPVGDRDGCDARWLGLLVGGVRRERLHPTGMPHSSARLARHTSSSSTPAPPPAASDGGHRRRAGGLGACGGL